MKNIIKLIGIIAIVAVIGFSMAACGNGDDGNGGGVNGGGTLTVTDIPAKYNGKYAYFQDSGHYVGKGYVIMGAQSVSASQDKTNARIANGSVTMSMYTNGNGGVKGYYGNDTLTTLITFSIYDSATSDDAIAIGSLSGGTFSNGSLTVSGVTFYDL